MPVRYVLLSVPLADSGVSGVLPLLNGPAEKTGGKWQVFRMVSCHITMHLCDTSSVLEMVYKASAAPAGLPFGRSSAISVHMHASEIQRRRRPGAQGRFVSAEKGRAPAMLYGARPGRDLPGGRASSRAECQCRLGGSSPPLGNVAARTAGSIRLPAGTSRHFKRTGSPPRRSGPMRTLAAHRVAKEIRAVCSSDAARWRRGRKKGSSAQGRMVAPPPGDPRPEKVSEVLSVGRIVGFCLFVPWRKS